jgi:hypothetical protein
MLDEAVETQLLNDIDVNNPALESPPDAKGKILQ